MVAAILYSFLQTGIVVFYSDLLIKIILEDRDTLYIVDNYLYQIMILPYYQRLFVCLLSHVMTHVTCHKPYKSYAKKFI